MSVLDMFVTIWENVQEKVYSRLQKAQAFAGPYSEYIAPIIKHDLKASRVFRARVSSPSLGLVFSRQDRHKEFRIQLLGGGNGTCSCGLFQNDKRPCPHALAFINHLGLAQNDYIASFHMANAWIGTCIQPLPPVMVSTLLSEPTIMPPLKKRKRGRPKKKRSERQGLCHEVTDNSGNAPTKDTDTQINNPLPNDLHTPIDGASQEEFDGIESVDDKAEDQEMSVGRLSLTAPTLPVKKRQRMDTWEYVLVEPTVASIIRNSRTRSGQAQ